MCAPLLATGVLMCVFCGLPRMCGYCHPKAEHWYQNYDKQAAPARDRLGVATHTAPREGFWNDIVHIATAAALTQLDAPRESMEAAAPYEAAAP